MDALSYRTQKQVPFELLAAVCAQLRHCTCPMPETKVFWQGCTGNHAAGAFGRNELSELRQTSRRWREAALDEGLREIVASNRWMRSGRQDRLRDISRAHGQRVRRLVFRSSDYYPNGPRRTQDGSAASELEAVLQMGWPRLDAVVIEWFSGSAADHARIAAAIRQWAPQAREVYIHDKLVMLTEMAPLVMAPAVRRLAVKPYGYNQRWSALAPNERGAAALVRRMPGQLTALAIGGADFSPQLLMALQDTQPNLKLLSIEHAWLDVLLAVPVCLPAVTRLHLENVIVSRNSPVLPLSARMFPGLRALTLSHTWQQAARDVADSARGAVSLQSEQSLGLFLAQQWPHLRSLTLPAVGDMDASRLPHACPALERLCTRSLDYGGPALSAAGLVDLLRGLKRLRHLSIEQRRSDGSPGYTIMDAALCRLIGAVDDDRLFGDRIMRRTSTASTIVDVSPPWSPQSYGSDTDVEDYFEPQVLSQSLNTLYIPRASFTAATLDGLLQQLPNLVRLSVSMRSNSFLAFSKAQPAQHPWAHQALRWIAISADEDILTDPEWLSAWLVQRFPQLVECSTNHARSHRQIITDLRHSAPAISFTRLGSGALQTR
ncbi:hypothetical protein LPJ55_001057 [Coemansia sp. RSA 990]|nr:hypothetical protein LPJ55_001057 [Coemansia sp. RSA 990]